MSLAGKVFVVTGGASGIGKATVKKLLSQSATVHVVDLSELPVINSSGGRYIRHSRVNVALRNDVNAVFTNITQQSSRLDGLLWDVNVIGTWNTNTEFYQSVKRLCQRLPNVQDDAQPSALIVNLGTMASVRGIPGMAGYVASKHAVLGLTRTFAQEWGPMGFRSGIEGGVQVLVGTRRIPSYIFWEMAPHRFLASVFRWTTAIREVYLYRNSALYGFSKIHV
ncbi:hypothetical protein BJX62DRAFT_241436 [Aspergillus germanicus]